MKPKFLTRGSGIFLLLAVCLAMQGCLLLNGKMFFLLPGVLFGPKEAPDEPMELQNPTLLSYSLPGEKWSAKLMANKIIFDNADNGAEIHAYLFLTEKTSLTRAARDAELFLVNPASVRSFDSEIKDGLIRWHWQNVNQTERGAGYAAKLTETPEFSIVVVGRWPIGCDEEMFEDFDSLARSFKVVNKK